MYLVNFLDSISSSDTIFCVLMILLTIISVILFFLIYTQNKGIVFIIKEFIVHDMYLIDVEENLVEQMKYIYGKGFKRLKDKVLGNNPTYLIH